MNFWDSSAIVALIAEEPLAPTAQDLLEADPLMVVWWGTLVECVAAAARKEREVATPVPPAADVLRRLDELAGRWREVQPGQRIRALARRLVRVHPLAAADALQLAAAVALAEDEPAGVGFVSFDARLNAAASREGFRLPTLRSAAGTPKD